MTPFECQCRRVMLIHRIEHPWFRLCRYARRGNVAVYTISSNGQMSNRINEPISRIRAETLSMMEVLKPGDLSRLLAGIDWQQWKLAQLLATGSQRKSEALPLPRRHSWRSRRRSKLAGLLRRLRDAFRASSPSVDSPTINQQVGHTVRPERFDQSLPHAQ